MFQACILSGHEGTLGGGQKIYFTLMGSCELRAPTIARQIVSLVDRTDSGSQNSHSVKQLFITLMGSVEIKAPTLTEEFVDFRDLLHSGKLSLSNWDRYAAEANRSDVEIATFTLMGSFSDGELPEDDAEIDALAMQRHLGAISDDAAEVLKRGIGQRGGERRATLRRAITSLVAAGSV
ncbi:MAG: hypothetical protein ACYTHJ_02405 [Planctomycetota bacterium]|jgi:hypothetical protein